jgi:hypothetical protein
MRGTSRLLEPDRSAERLPNSSDHQFVESVSSFASRLTKRHVMGKAVHDQCFRAFLKHSIVIGRGIGNGLNDVPVLDDFATLQPE